MVGDATEDAVLAPAGIDRARRSSPRSTATPPTRSSSLSARALQPDLFIVARARSQDSREKLRRAGADRVVNPQSIGGARMAAFVLRPHVAEFLDVVMHERTLEFRLEEIEVPDRQPIVGRTSRETQLRDHTGALVLALRDADGTFHTNPRPTRGSSRAGDHRDRHPGRARPPSSSSPAQVRQLVTAQRSTVTSRERPSGSA